MSSADAVDDVVPEKRAVKLNRCVCVCCKFLTESVSERILKIGEHLEKYWAGVKCFGFFDSRCIK